jgi:fibronectin type 3 domain-containing protein
LLAFGLVVPDTQPLFAAAQVDTSLSVRPFAGVPPSAAGSFVASPTASEGQVQLNWTAPSVMAGSALDSYQVRVQTYPVSDVGTAAAWWSTNTGAFVQGLYGELPGAAVVRTLGPNGSDHPISLFPGATYYFGVRSADDVGVTRDFWSAIATSAAVSPVDAAPGTPAGLSATAGATDIALSWTALSTPQRGPDFDRYRLYRSTQSGGTFAFLGATTSTNFTDSSANMGVRYYYRVTGIDLGSPGSPGLALEGPPSAEATAAIALSPPGSLTGVPLSTSEIGWSWPLVPGATAYSIATSANVVLQTLNDPATSWTEVGLSTNTAYSRKILASNDASSSTYSSAVTRYTHAAAPAAVAMTSRTSNSITLTWSAEGNPASTSYGVERSPDGVSFTQVLLIASTTGQDVGLTPSTTYHYRVRAFNGDSVPSAYSAVTMAQTGVTLIQPLPPQTVWGDLEDNTFTLHWRPVTRNESGQVETIARYIIERADSLLGTVNQTFQVAPGVTTFSDSTGGRSYYYRIKAVSTGGAESDWSDTVDSSPQVNRIIVAPDDVSSRVTLPRAMSLELLAQNNTYGDDLVVVPIRQAAQENAETLRAYNFVVRRASNAEDVPNFSFSQPVLLVRVAYGPPASSVVSTLGNTSAAPSAGAVNLVYLYWYNGADFVRVGGTVLLAEQTLEIATRNLGRYEARVVRLPNGFALTRGSPYPRVITPNASDNRRVFFFFDNPSDAPVSGVIYDLRGAKIRELSVNSLSPTPNSLVWDGKTEDGTVVRAGVYLYKITAGKESVTGTVVVAR